MSNLAAARVAHDGPFEYTSTLKLIESTFRLHPPTNCYIYLCILRL